jgi:hypothetical protein
MGPQGAHDGLVIAASRDHSRPNAHDVVAEYGHDDLTRVVINRTPEFATGHDSPTSILCLQCPSRILLFQSHSRRCAGNPGAKALKCSAKWVCKSTKWF